MEDWERAALVGTAILAPPLVIATILAVLAQQSSQNVLTVIVSGPGTVDITQGTHSYSHPTEVTVTATPAAGYQANWTLNTVDVEQGVNVYSVYVNGVVTLGVYFTPIGPSYGTIAGIRAVGTVGTLQNLEYLFEAGTGPIDIFECDEAWNQDAECQPALMQYKVYDDGGVGIPNIPINIYPDVNPDTTIFKSIAMYDQALSGTFHPTYFDANSPLTLTTDSNGLVSFRIRNLYAAEGTWPAFPQVIFAPSGFGKQLSTSTGVYANTVTLGIIILQNRVFPIYKSLAAGLGNSWINGGGGSTVQYNRNIRADIINTAYYTIQPITVSLATKWG